MFHIKYRIEGINIDPYSYIGKIYYFTGKNGYLSQERTILSYDSVKDCFWTDLGTYIDFNVLKIFLRNGEMILKCKEK